jgi:hypothetical protein
VLESGTERLSAIEAVKTLKHPIENFISLLPKFGSKTAASHVYKYITIRTISLAAGPCLAKTSSARSNPLWNLQNLTHT